VATLHQNNFTFKQTLIYSCAKQPTEVFLSQKMKALVLPAIKQALVYQDIEKPMPKAGQVLVQLHAAALNHRDVYIQQGLYAHIKTPVILGSDGAGQVVAVGEGVATTWLNADVIILPGIGWEKGAVQPKDYQILGMPDDGCLAQYIVVDVKQVFAKPSHLSFEQAAALPLAGLTAFRALMVRAQATGKDRVLISGIGGGVALMAFQMAIALGAEVYVTSSSEEKIKRAIELGAAGGANYKTENWHKALKEQAGGEFDVIVDSAGGDGFKRLVDIAAPAGRIVFYGGTRGKFTVSPQRVFWKQLSILGSTMGSSAEFERLLEFVAAQKLVPVVDSTWALEKGQEALEYMDQGQQFGKIVVSIPPVK
jgi:NADPH:quinone reductase-like Zn-dependent oxidoreductase